LGGKRLRRQPSSCYPPLAGEAEHLFPPIALFGNVGGPQA